jgi:hypothetical protein
MHEKTYRKGKEEVQKYLTIYMGRYTFHPASLNLHVQGQLQGIPTNKGMNVQAFLCLGISIPILQNGSHSNPSLQINNYTCNTVSSSSIKVHTTLGMGLGLKGHSRIDILSI